MRRLLFSVVGIAAVLAVVAAGSSSGAGRAGSGWVVRDLGTLGGPSSYPTAIGAGGRVVGAADTTATYTAGQDAARARIRMPIQHAFVWEGGTLRDLGAPLGGPGSWARAVNERGQVVGAAETTAVAASGHHVTRAFLWQEGRVRDLGALPGWRTSEAAAINDGGRVIGSSCQDVAHRCRAFLWRDGKLVDLGTLGGAVSDAVDIDERGRVVGTAWTGAKSASGTPTQRAFLWRNGTMTDLGTLGGSSSGAVAIGDGGRVTGWAETGATYERGYAAGLPVRHAFLWQKGTMRDLGTLGGEYSSPTAINASGQVVGSAATKEGNPHAFLWRDGKMIDLGTLPGRPSVDALAINDRGQVVGAACDFERERCTGFLWQDGKMIELGGLGGLFTQSRAVGIDREGRIVGEAWAPPRTSSPEELHRGRAVLWTLRRGI